MTQNCRHCASERVIPVIYERMDRANYLAGNKFRKRCLECKRWLPMCSAEEWRTHEEPMVLPAGVDPNDPELVPAAEAGYEDRLDSAENEFECPSSECSTVHAGFPEECDQCGVPYQW